MRDRVSVRITRDEAKAFFAHPSQLKASMLQSPDDLPEGVEYWADGPLCLMFHPAFWPGVWMVHHAAKPEGWGHLVDPAQRLLRAFWEDHQPERIIGWTDARNRAAIAFARRVGFREDGRMQLNGHEVLMTGWRL